MLIIWICAIIGFSLFIFIVFTNEANGTHVLASIALLAFSLGAWIWSRNDSDDGDLTIGEHSQAAEGIIDLGHDQQSIHPFAVCGYCNDNINDTRLNLGGIKECENCRALQHLNCLAANQGNCVNCNKPLLRL